ncbi:uncharacterized protein LOC117124318 [Anneissia japonica]|uniref:uncharacterized protein LOC117124318 n=1 Tax=Anneissia japonica TaxID=1529436 RepID=UPI0014259A9E|nr:uncharacterized protein LOC117124318 [Anneissia japonica]XP_033126398.1 uncharacterized protein LOC117124318 [Anneissia japonica]XP_033126399.1 uncharacterized protein LOC117124318 [Anneissia japonica]XP_033126400.1 uncharacterized protein LOC117124318 [Anneissia japonica]
MATVVQQAPPHTVVVPGTVQYQHAVGPLPGDNLNQQSAKTSGWIQVSCGTISVVLGVIAIAIDACNSYSANAIWCGVIFYIPAGILGVCAARGRSPCTIIGCMVMSILASIFSVTHFAVNLSGAMGQSGCSYYDDYDNEGAKIAVNSMLAFTAVVEFFISIYASTVMCGGTTCCCHTTPNQTVTVIQTHPVATTAQVVHSGYVGRQNPTGYTQPQLTPGFTQYGQQQQMPYKPPPSYQNQQQPQYQYQQQPTQEWYDNPPPYASPYAPPYAPAPDAKM